MIKLVLDCCFINSDDCGMHLCLFIFIAKRSRGIIVGDVSIIKSKTVKTIVIFHFTSERNPLSRVGIFLFLNHYLRIGIRYDIDIISNRILTFQILICGGNRIRFIAEKTTGIVKSIFGTRSKSKRSIIKIQTDILCILCIEIPAHLGSCRY